MFILFTRHNYLLHQYLLHQVRLTACGGRLEHDNRVVFRYCTANSDVIDEANPNGSLHNIAGIVNDQGNVCGLTPHPERAVDPLLGGTDGQKIFASVFRALVEAGSV